MKTVREVSKLTGVSVRTLRYYDAIGLLRPAAVSQAGYRLYDDAALERLQHILMYRELQFPLKDVKSILNSPDFDRNRALEQQIELLTLKKEHLETLILFARGIQGIGVRNLDFTAFDARKLDEYVRQAKEAYGHTSAWQEYEQKAEELSDVQKNVLNAEMMSIFKAFGELMGKDPSCAEVQAQVEALKAFITSHFYTCTSKILSGLGRIYAGGGSVTESIDRAGGEGTAVFVSQAIAARG